MNKNAELDVRHGLSQTLVRHRLLRGALGFIVGTHQNVNVSKRLSFLPHRFLTRCELLNELIGSAALIIYVPKLDTAVVYCNY